MRKTLAAIAALMTIAVAAPAHATDSTAGPATWITKIRSDRFGYEYYLNDGTLRFPPPKREAIGSCGFDARCVAEERVAYHWIATIDATLNSNDKALPVTSVSGSPRTGFTVKWADLGVTHRRSLTAALGRCDDAACRVGTRMAFTWIGIAQRTLAHVGQPCTPAWKAQCRA